MSSAGYRIREAIEAFHRGRGAAEIEWLRHGGIEESWRGAARFLLSEQGAQLESQLSASGELSQVEHGFVGRQLAHVAASSILAEARPRLGQLLATQLPVGSGAEAPRELLVSMLKTDAAAGRQLRAQALASALDAHAKHFAELRQKADATWLTRWAQEQPARKPTLQELAEALLYRTDDAAHDTVRWATRALDPSGKPAWHTLLVALRRPELDGLARVARRHFRLAAGLRGLGFEREMNARMRVESGGPLLFPVPRLAVLAVPGDLRVAQTSLEWGVLSDLQAADAMGRALALALVSPALAPELRWPMDGGVSTAFGTLFMQLHADVLYLRTVAGLPPSEAATLARHAALLVLLQVRVSAALAIAGQAPARNLDERIESLVAAMRRALGVSVPPGLAVLAWFGAPALGVDVEARLAGLAVHAGLRERLDADWFRNPRSEELLRGAGARGNTLDAHGFATELGVDLSAASQRLLELLA